MGQVGRPEDRIRERFSLAGVRPEKSRPESVRPCLEPLSTQGAAPEMETSDLAEDEQKEKEDSERKEEHAEREEEHSEDKEEKNIRSRIRPAPEEPSEQEREEHEMTHLPYQAWCPHCVAGKAPNEAHRKQETEENKMIDEGKVPRIGIDFWFMSDEEDEKGQNPIVIMVDKQTKCHVSYPVVSKSVSDWIVRRLCDDLETWGYMGEDVMIRCDGEPSIRLIRQSIALFRRGKTVPEDIPPGEHEQMGFVEAQVKSTRNQFKTLRSSLERSLGEGLPADTPALQWLIRWSSMTLTRYQVGADGKTGYERMKNRRCNMAICAFGEMVMYKELHPAETQRDKSVMDWKQGLYLGGLMRSNESVVGTEQGVIKAFAIKRMAGKERWNLEAVKSMPGTLMGPDPSRPGRDRVPIRIEARIEREVEQPSGSDGRKKQVRIMKITRKILEKVGFTEECEGCRYMQAGMEEQREHSEKCRQRIEKELVKTEEGQRKIRAQ